jgi:hypothetical protein
VLTGVDTSDGPEEMMARKDEGDPGRDSEAGLSVAGDEIVKALLLGGLNGLGEARLVAATVGTLMVV